MKRFGYALLLLVVLFGFGGVALAEGEENTEAQTGWVSEGGKWFYVNPSDGSPATGWMKIDGVWYYFGSNGDMLTGWQKIDGKYYYLKSSGAMATGWYSVNGRWYYMQSSGAMTTGWLKQGSTWYYLRDSGAMVSNDWAKINSVWYWFDSSGVMATGSKVIGGKTYQFATNGAWIDQSTGTPGTSTFAQLAPTTRMSFVELVGDNGDYNSIKKYPAKGKYKLVVDLYHQVVLAYSKDSKGNYTVPVRYMVTTTGGPKTPTPVGTYSCKDSRRRFSQFSTGEYAQYWVRVVGEIYFHSLLYTKANANNYMESSYRLLGSRGSHGCIRLLVPDARWVYYNIAPGTTVQIRAGSASDTATANIKKQLTRASLPKSRPNCNGVGNTDVWSISGLNAQLN